MPRGGLCSRGIPTDILEHPRSKSTETWHQPVFDYRRTVGYVSSQMGIYSPIHGQHIWETWWSYMAWLGAFPIFMYKPNFPCMPWLRPLLSRSCALTLIWLPTLQKSRPSKWKLSFWSRKIASASWSPFVEARYWQGLESPITWTFTDNYLPSPSPPVFWKQFCCGSIPPWDIVARSSQSASSASSDIIGIISIISIIRLTLHFLSPNSSHTAPLPHLPSSPFTQLASVLYPLTLSSYGFVWN